MKPELKNFTESEQLRFFERTKRRLGIGLFFIDHEGLGNRDNTQSPQLGLITLSKMKVIPRDKTQDFIHFLEVKSKRLKWARISSTVFAICMMIIQAGAEETSGVGGISQGIAAHPFFVVTAISGIPAIILSYVSWWDFYELSGWTKVFPDISQPGPLHLKIRKDLDSKFYTDYLKGVLYAFVDEALERSDDGQGTILGIMKEAGVSIIEETSQGRQ